MLACGTTGRMSWQRPAIPQRVVVHFRNRCASFVRGVRRESPARDVRPLDPVDCAQGHVRADRERQLPTLAGTMKVSLRARIREGALSLLALATLLSVLYVADFRVREGATHIVSTTSNTGVARYGSELAA